MKMAVRACQLFLKSLPKDSYFNVTGFGSNYVTLFQGMAPYTKSNLEHALSKVKMFLANLGGT